MNKIHKQPQQFAPPAVIKKEETMHNSNPAESEMMFPDVRWWHRMLSMISNFCSVGALRRFRAGGSTHQF
jgi:hypothetical protein